MVNLIFRLISCVVFAFVIYACSTETVSKQTLFESLPSESTNVDFINKLSFDDKFNIYTYRNFYNGGGVGLGDFNNDGLIDIYLTANQLSNKLYVNKGNLKFDDITQQAGVAGSKAWSTGVSVADVNGDGWLDIYVCNSGDIKGDDKENELFINNGDLTFTEKAKEYGIADNGFTTHAVFFDYDQDGDLDLYILNNSYQAIGSFNLMKNERPKRDSLGGDKLMRNEGTHFVDVSEHAGIYGSVIGFGLGATVGDVNDDGWPDIYVSNDFFERDYLYINNKNGTFTENLTEQIQSISAASMGADMADINNDGWPDIFVTDMLPKTNARLKTVTTFESWDRYRYGVNNDYYHQFTRNTLQLNNGDNSFSEIGRLAGVEATDWSWGALMFDMDNDGLKDIFVANGIYQDLTNQDYLQYITNEEVARAMISKKGVDYKKLVELIPSNPVSNFAFKNKGNLRFENVAEAWGLGNPNFSNGSAYGDLDNDGDLDLVINHVNAQVSINRNNAERLMPENRYLKFILKGSTKNSQAIGTKITLIQGDKKFFVEQVPNRGFESSVDPRPNIGLGAISIVDTIQIKWPDGAVSILSNVPTNQVLTLEQSQAKYIVDASEGKIAYSEILLPIKPVLNWKHKENEFVDFDRDKLVYHMLSGEGPQIAVADIDGDGLDDLYLGGAKDSPGVLLKQNSRQQFDEQQAELFEIDKSSEDTGTIFFDADTDGDLDLYVCSGGSEFSSISTALKDRLYINSGNGVFEKSEHVLPEISESTSVVRVSDYDKDGDLDLFIGTRSKLFGYGMPVNGYILENNGKGIFKNITNDIAKELIGIGMITDALWVDVDNDEDDDLIVVGEYMSVNIFINNNGKFERTELPNLNGWWNRLKAADLDADGDIDFVVANHGLNSRFRASLSHPISTYINDFDKNGTIEQIVCMYDGASSFPLVLRHDLMMQIPILKKKYLKYENYRDQTINDIFSEAELKDANLLHAYELRTGILLNDGTGKFSFQELPIEAQYAPMFAISIFDYDLDGKMDIILGGNQYLVKPEMGRYDASYGVFLKGHGNGQFTSLSTIDSGLALQGVIRDFGHIRIGDSNVLIALRNNDSPQFFRIKSNSK
jgi:hypothetical protein